MSLNLTPLGDRVIVEPLESEEVTPGGIVLPETAKERPQKGKVLAVGPGARDDQGKRVPIDIKVGDTVLYGRYSGTEVKIKDKKYLILRENDVLAVIE